jgi:hypothetical protein
MEHDHTSLAFSDKPFNKSEVDDMRRILIALALALTLAVLSLAQSPSTTQIRPGQPVKTIKIGKASFSYYEIPEAVAAAATFYINGGATTAHLKNFVALTAFFTNRGKNLIAPASVQFRLVATTYRDGCMYRDNHHLAISLDNQALISTDLSTQQVSTSETRFGKLCTELYAFSISYEQFVQLADAKKVVVRLGLKEFKLKEEHLNALHAMKDGIGHY